MIKTGSITYSVTLYPSANLFDIKSGILCWLLENLYYFIIILVSLNFNEPLDKIGLDFIISDSNLLRFVKRKIQFAIILNFCVKYCLPFGHSFIYKSPICPLFQKSKLSVEEDNKNYPRTGSVCIEGDRIRREIERESGIFKNEIT